MATFPRLRTEAYAQYPSSRSIETSTNVMRFVDGTEQRFRNLKRGVKRWILRMHEIDEQELAAIEQFYESQQGRAGSFTFIDPWDGTEYTDCSFETDVLELTVRDHAKCDSTVVIRSNQV